MKSFQDTNGISRPERLEQRIRGSSRISGMSSAGTVLLGYVSLSIKHARGPSKFGTKIACPCMQENRLWVADPKAINHIMQKSGYFYTKPSDAREQIALLADRRGIGTVEGWLFIRHIFSLAHLTIPQMMHTNATDG